LWSRSRPQGILPGVRAAERQGGIPVLLAAHAEDDPGHGLEAVEGDLFSTAAANTEFAAVHPFQCVVHQLQLFASQSAQAGCNEFVVRLRDLIRVVRRLCGDRLFGRRRAESQQFALLLDQRPAHLIQKSV
jgi:hypothetical protein